jgi:hypothetical protein
VAWAVFYTACVHTYTPCILTQGGILTAQHAKKHETKK